MTNDDIFKKFKHFSMSVGKDEAERLVRMVDQSGNISINVCCCRELLLFQSAEDVAKILEYWRHEICLDVGCHED